MMKPKTIFKILTNQNLTIPAEVLRYQDEYLFMRGRVMCKDKNRKDCMVVRVERIPTSRYYFEICDIVKWLDDPGILRDVPEEQLHYLGADVATIMELKQHDYVGNVRNPDYKTTSSGGSEPESRDGDTKNESGSATSESGKEALLDHVTATRGGGSQLISGVLARGVQYIMQPPKSNVISPLLEPMELSGKHQSGRYTLPPSLQASEPFNTTVVSRWHGQVNTKSHTSVAAARKRSADVSPVTQPTQKAARLAERVLSYGSSLLSSQGSSQFYMAVNTKLQQEAACLGLEAPQLASVASPTPAPRVPPSAPPTTVPSQGPDAAAAPASSDMSSDATQKMSTCDDVEDDVTWPGLTAWFGGNWRVGDHFGHQTMACWQPPPDVDRSPGLGPTS